MPTYRFKTGGFVPIYPASSNVSDTTAPVLATATVPSAGTSIVLTFTEANNPPLIPASGITGFSAKINGGAATISSVTRTAPLEVTLALGSTVLDTDTVVVSYNQGTGNLTDSATSPNELTAFTDSAITNNSTQTGGGGGATADFTVTPAYPAEGDTVDFTYTGTGATTWSWKKDGVEFSTIENPTGIDLGSAGTYTIELTVNGGEDVSSQDVTVFPVGALEAETATFATAYNATTGADMDSGTLLSLDAFFKETKETDGGFAESDWLYFVLGGTAERHMLEAFGEKNATLVDANSRIVHSASGMQRSISFSDGYIDTGIAGATEMDFADFALIFYGSGNIGGSNVFANDGDGDGYTVRANFAGAGNNNAQFARGGADSTFSSPDANGCFIFSKTGNTITIWRTHVVSGVITTTQIGTDSTVPTYGMPTQAMRFGSGYDSYRFYGVAKGLNSTKAANLGAAIERLQSGLGRSAFSLSTLEQGLNDAVDDNIEETGAATTIFSGGSRIAAPTSWIADATNIESFPEHRGYYLGGRLVRMADHFQTGTFTFNVAGVRTTLNVINTALVAGTDIRIGLLDGDVPVGVSPVKLAPANIGTLMRPSSVPFIILHYGTNATVANGTIAGGQVRTFHSAQSGVRDSFFSPIVSGASGSNVVWRTSSGELIALCSVWLGVANPDGSGNFIGSLSNFDGYHATAIQAAMDSLASGTTLQIWTP